MRIVRIRTDGVEAALARFDGWWNARSHRERVMLGVLAALLAGVVLVYGVVKPLQAARAEAFADIRTYETLGARIRAGGTLRPGAAPRTGTPIDLVNQTAAAAGIVATVEPIPGGGVRATIADGSYEALLGWIAELDASTPLRARRVSIRRRPAPGHVSATVDFGA